MYLLNRTESVHVSKSLYVSLQWDAGLCQSVCRMERSVHQSLYVSVKDVQSRVSICPSVETASICSDNQFSSVRKTVSDCRDSQHASAGHKCTCVSVCTSPWRMYEVRQ